MPRLPSSPVVASTFRLQQERQQFLQQVFGGFDTEERFEVALALRRQIITGILPPQVLVTLLHLLLGKPTESYDVTHRGTIDYAGMTDAQLSERAQMVAGLLRGKSGAAPDDEDGPVM